MKHLLIIRFTNIQINFKILRNQIRICFKDNLCSHHHSCGSGSCGSSWAWRHYLSSHHSAHHWWLHHASHHWWLHHSSHHGLLHHRWLHHTSHHWLLHHRLLHHWLLHWLLHWHHLLLWHGWSNLGYGLSSNHWLFRCWRSFFCCLIIFFTLIFWLDGDNTCFFSIM